ncbi:MAG TPA: alpha/beta hydrolase [Anaerolineae bacterium]|nr:alpha/beta hydrolase [Anaerolineae bacterium]
MANLQELHIEGHKLAVLSFNPDQAGPPVILIHSIIASIYFWSPDLLAPFLNVGPCYSLSLPGHYPAAFPAGFAQASLTADHLAHVMTGAIRQLVGTTPCILVGHSTGGFAVLNIAAHTPELARNVISISGFAQGRWTGLLGAYQRLTRSGPAGQWGFKALLRLGHLERIYRATARFYVVDRATLAAYPNIQQTLHDSCLIFRNLSAREVIHYFATMPDIDISGMMSRIRVPTLILTGDRDPIVPPAQADVIAQRVANGALIALHNVGHFPFYEQPTEYQRALKDWMAINLRPMK